MFSILFISSFVKRMWSNRACTARYLQLLLRQQISGSSGSKAKPQEEAATVAAVSRSEDAADSNMHLYVYVLDV